MRLGLGLLVFAPGCIVGGGDGTWTFTDATELWVSIASGNVDVTPSGDTNTIVTYDGGGVGRAARPDVSEDDAGRVTVDGHGQLGGGDITAQVSDGVAITAQVDRGDIDIELQAPADVDACVAAGSVSIGLPAGSYAFDLDMGVGAIGVEFVDDPSADHTVHVCVGAGSVDLHVYDPAAVQSAE